MAVAVHFASSQRLRPRFTPVRADCRLADAKRTHQRDEQQPDVRHRETRRDHLRALPPLARRAPRRALAHAARRGSARGRLRHAGGDREDPAPGVRRRAQAVRRVADRPAGRAGALLRDRLRRRQRDRRLRLDHGAAEQAAAVEAGRSRRLRGVRREPRSRRVDLRDPLAHAALRVARLAALVPPHARRRPEHPSERRHARDRHRQDVGAQPVPAARDARPLRRQGGRCQLLAHDAEAHRVQHGLCHRMRAAPPPHARANLPGDRPPRRGRRERAAAAAPPLVAAAAGRPVGAVLPRRIELGRVGL